MALAHAVSSGTTHPASNGPVDKHVVGDLHSVGGTEAVEVQEVHILAWGDEMVQKSKSCNGKNGCSLRSHCD